MKLEQQHNTQVTSHFHQRLPFALDLLLPFNRVEWKRQPVKNWFY